AANEKRKTPVNRVISKLMGLKKKYPWIRTFEANPTSEAGHFSLVMIASKNKIKDYNQEEEDPEGYKKELPPGKTRSPEQNKKARNYFKNNKEKARNLWEQRTGKRWPVIPDTNQPQWAEHPRPLKDGGHPLHVEPGEGPDPNKIHKEDHKRWGAMGTPAREAKKKERERRKQSRQIKKK